MCGFCDYVTLCHHSIALIAETKSPGFHQYAPKLTQQTYCGQNILPKWSLNSDGTFDVAICSVPRYKKALIIAWVFPYNDLRPNPGMMVRGKYPKKVLFQVSETLRCT